MRTNIHPSFSHIRSGAALGAALLVVTVACATTRLQSSWVKPGTGPFTFKKVVAIALSKTPGRRRILEDAMATQIRLVSDVHVVPSYSIISDSDLMSEPRVREAIDRAGFDGGVFLRVIDISHRDVFVPGVSIYAPVYYQTFWGYYRYWAPIVYEPGSFERQTAVQVETEVYSTAGEGDLLYSAVSRTVNPSSPTDLVERVARVVTRDLRAKGLLLPPNVPQ